MFSLFKPEQGIVGKSKSCCALKFGESRKNVSKRARGIGTYNNEVVCEVYELKYWSITWALLWYWDNTLCMEISNNRFHVCVRKNSTDKREMHI